MMQADGLWNAGHEPTFTWPIGPADFIEFANPFFMPNSQVLNVEQLNLLKMLTDFVQQSYFLGFICYSGTVGINRSLWNLKVYCCVHKRLRQGPYPVRGESSSHTRLSTSFL
jgi:hypothetical protein